MAKTQTKDSSTTGYLTFNDSNKSEILTKYGSVLNKFDRMSGYTKATTDVTTRSPFYQNDYYRERPADLMPSDFKDVVAACRQIYLRIGVVRNVIDLMTDFAAEDLEIVHPNKKVQALFKVWFKKVELRGAVEEFIRHFLVDGNVVVKRITAKLTKPVEKQWIENESLAAPDIKIYKDIDDVLKNEIPWKYSFLNIMALEWKGGEEAKMNGTRQLVFRPSKEILSLVNKKEELFKNQHKTGLEATISGDAVSLDMSKLYVAHNKKDSWENWSPPFLYTILADVQFKQKLRQAEISALDGMINVIRLWKLGDHEQKIFPSEAAVQKLIDIMQNNTGGGAIDIVWDSMIEMVPHYPPVKDILGAEKFTEVDKDILIGLGVPEVLIGGQGANFSNSFIQLKTLVERLKTIRAAVQEWLSNEIILMSKSLGLSSLPIIKFSQINLEDENTTRKLIVGLLDRGVISVESVLNSYGENFLMEQERIKQEKDAGIKAKSPLDNKPKPNGQKPSKNTNTGRPPVSKDSSTRDQRTPKPRRSSAELSIFAMDTIDVIDEILIPVYMENINVTNARKLTSDQKEEINQVRVGVLSCIKPGDNVSEDTILDIAENSKDKLNSKIINIVNENINKFIKNSGYPPSLSQRKRIEALSWSQYYENNS